MSQPGIQKSFTKIYHKTPYPAISPLLPALSAAGKTVLITAGGSGIGFSAATAFAEAKASHIILLSRRQQVLEEAKKKLNGSHPSTQTHVYACSVTDTAALSQVFSSIKTTIGHIDIVVSSAVNLQLPISVRETPPYTQIQETFDTIVNGGLNMLKNFIENDPDSKKEKVFINISSLSAHFVIPGHSGYAAAKMAFLTLLQHYHMEYHRSGLRIYSIHPGAIFTAAAQAFGAQKDMIKWDNAELPGCFCVWLASEQARFLAGRFLWANWDVKELMEREREFKEDEDLLKVGLMGCGGHELYPLNLTMKSD